MRVVLLGRGALGSAVAELLPRRVAGVQILASFGRRDASSIGRLLDEADLLVEMASHEALGAHGPRAIAAGVDVLVASVGALSDERLEAAMRAGPGVLHLPSGAIGGLDLLGAAAKLDGLDQVRLTSEKSPDLLLRPWMGRALVRSLERRERRIVFSGSAREAARAFPASANVAATLALRTIGLDRCQVEVASAPERAGARHTVEASGPVGTYRFVMDNAPSTSNPATSAVTVCSVLAMIEEVAKRRDARDGGAPHRTDPPIEPVRTDPGRERAAAPPPPADERS